MRAFMSSASAALRSTARTSSRRSWRRHGSRTARDLELWVRVAVPAKNSSMPLERKFGTTGAKAQRLLVKTRQAADELGITFHVGSQTTTPDAYVSAFEEVRQADRRPGVVARPPRRRRRLPFGLHGQLPAPLSSLRRGHRERRRTLPVGGSLPADVRAGPRAGGGGRSPDRARRCATRQRAVHQRRQPTARCSMPHIWVSISRSSC